MSQIVTVNMDVDSMPDRIAVVRNGKREILCRDECRDLHPHEEDNGEWVLGNSVPEIIEPALAGENCSPCAAGHDY